MLPARWALSSECRDASVRVQTYAFRYDSAGAPAGAEVPAVSHRQRLRTSSTWLRSSGCRAREHEGTRRAVSPLTDSALEGAPLPIWEYAGEFRLQARNEILPDEIGLGFQPCTHARPHPRKRIVACPPITRRARRRAMRLADFAMLPRRRQAREESIEVAFARRHQVRRLACGQAGEMVLHRPTLL